MMAQVRIGHKLCGIDFTCGGLLGLNKEEEGGGKAVDGMFT